MLIIKVTPFFLPSEGGTQRVVLNLSREFAKMGHQVTVLSYNAVDNTAKGPLCTASLKSFEKINQIDVHRFKYSALTGEGLKFSVSLSFSMLKSLLNKKGDVVHYHGFFHLPNVVFLSFWCKLTRTPLFLTTHGIHEATSDYHNYSNPFMKLLALATIKIVLKNVDTFIALTHADELALVNFGLPASRICCVPNGVDTSKFERAKSDENLLSRYGLRSAKSLVLCVCRIARNKGLTYLVKASSKLSSKVSNLIVLIVGPTQEKSYKAELINLVNDLKVSAIVNFRENVPDADLVDFYKTADLFVLPSEQETLPLVIFEAMAAGCPLIATSVGGIPDVITDNVNGLLVKPGNEDELVEKMLLVLSDDTLNKKLRVQEKKTAMEYSWTKIAKKTLILYQNRL